MDKTKILKMLYEQSLGGNFQNLYTILKDHHNNVEDTNKVKIISTCINTCIKNPNKNISHDYLSKSLKVFTSSIQYLSDGDFLMYLQSIHHLLRTFINKECFHLIIDMEDVFLPSFMPIKLTTKHNEVYIATCKLLHNIVAHSLALKEEQMIKHMLRISCLVTKICSNVSQPTSLLQLSYGCFTNLYHLKITIDEQEKYFLYIIQSLENTRAQLNKEDFFNSYLSMISIILNKILENHDFARMKAFLNNIRQSVSNWNGFKEFEQIFNILEFVLVMSPLEYENKVELIATSKKSLKNLCKLWKGSTNIERLKNKYATLTTYLTQYYQTKNNKHWCQYTEEMQLECIHFIYNISEMNSRTNINCSCGCTITNNAFQSFTFFQQIVVLIDISKVTESLKFHKLCVKLLSDFCAIITYLQLNNCEKWKSAYETFSQGVYYIAQNLLEKSNDTAILYYTLLMQHFFKHRGIGEILPKNRWLNSTLSSICSVYTKDIKKSLAFSALAIFICPDFRRYFMSIWVKNKHSLRENEEFSRISLVEAFSTFSKEITSLIGMKYILTPSEKVELLTLELQQYKKNWQSKIPMMTALKELFHLTETNKMVEIIVELYGNCDLQIHEDVAVILDKVLKNYENQLDNDTNCLQSKMYLAILCFLHYKYTYKETIKKNINEVEKNINFLNDKPNAASKDPNEECDVVSSYESLKLDTYISNIKYLNKALELLISMMPHYQDLTNYFANVHSILMSIAFEYRLICYKVKCNQALQLALKIAQSKDNFINTIEIVSFLIEKSDSKVTKHLVDLAEEALKNINPTESSNIKIVLTYLIFKAKMLFYSDTKESFKMFKQAMEMLDKIETTENAILTCQLLALNFQYFLLPCDLKIEDHSHGASMKIYSACMSINLKIAKLDKAYEFSVLFDINEEIVKYYYLMRCPREVRVFSKEFLLLTQKMVLPLRSVTFLSYLAWADLYSSRYEDCQVKLNGIADILCLPKYKPKFEECISKKSSPTNLTVDIGDLSNDIQEMVLDNQETRRQQFKKQMLSVSPTIDVQPFHFPSFVQHNKLCECFYCSCFEYQLVVLKKVRLDAIFNVKQQNWQLVQDIYHGGLKLYQICIIKCSSYCDRTDFLWRYCLSSEYLSIYGYLLLEYSKHLMRNDKKTDAININKKLIELLTPLKLEHIYLYQDATLQKLMYLTHNIARQDENKSHVIVDNIEIDDISKTPETLHNTVNVPANLSPCSPIPEISQKLPRKKLTFNVSPVQTSSNKSPNEIKVLQELPATKKENLRTPASKIQIYESPNKQTNKKKKSSENYRSMLPLLVVPTTLGPSTSSVEESTIRKTRAKLLTQKIKQPAKKTDNITNDENICNGNVAVKSDGRLLRKNLLKELVDDQNDRIIENSTRKSSRNKK